MEFLEIKIATSEIKISLDGINTQSRLDIAEEKNSKPEGIPVEFGQNKKTKTETTKKRKRVSVIYELIPNILIHV